MTKYTPEQAGGEVCTPPLAIATIPLQSWQEPYDLCTALKEGTIFPDLNRPFYMGGRDYVQ